MKLFYSLGLLLSGTGTTMLAKAVDRRGFNHPYVQVFLMFLAEMLLLLFSICSGKVEGDFSKQWKFVIPALLDVMGSSCVFLGLQRLTASKFQLLRCSLVPFTSLVSYVVFRRIPTKYEGFAVVVIVISIACLSFVPGHEVTGDEDSLEEGILGGMFILTAQFLLAFQLVWEEKMFKGMDTLRSVGFEGLWGLIFSIPPLLMFNDTKETIEEVKQDSIIAGCLLASAAFVALLNIFSIKLMSVSSAPVRTVVDTSRIASIWLISILIGWENHISWIQLSCFAGLIFGVATYNAIIKLPCFTYPDNEAIREPLLSSDVNVGASTV